MSRASRVSCAAGRRGTFGSALILVLVLASAVSAAGAQQMPVPVDIQVPLLIKVLHFDRNLGTRAGGELVVGILFQKRNRDSLNAKNGFVEAFARSQRTEIAGVPVRPVEIDLEREGNLAAALMREEVDVLYVAPLRAVALDEIAVTAQQAGIMTLSGVPDYVEAGVIVGITERASRPSILVNLEAARAADVDFGADFLKVAQVVRR